MNEKLDCQIVQDLLPLYHDDVVRPHTKEAIAAHLAQCPSCRAEYQELCADLPVSVPESEGFTGGKYTAMVRRRRRKHLLLAALVLILAAALSLLFWPRSVSAICDLPTDTPLEDCTVIVTNFDEDQRYTDLTPDQLSALQEAITHSRASWRWFDPAKVIVGDVDGYRVYLGDDLLYFTEEGVLFTDHFRWQLTDGSLQRLLAVMEDLPN